MGCTGGFPTPRETVALEENAEVLSPSVGSREQQWDALGFPMPELTVTVYGVWNPGDQGARQLLERVSLLYQPVASIWVHRRSPLPLL